MARETGRHVQVPERHLNIAALVLGLVAAAALGVTVWALFFRETEPTILAPDYAPQELERNAEDMEDTGAEKLEASSGGGAVSLMYQDQVVVQLSQGTAALNYGNPRESTQDVLVQIVVQDRLIAQSGLLTPGHQVNRLSLAEGAAELLEPGGYEGKFILSFYDPDTAEKANVNTEVPITVTVME